MIREALYPDRRLSWRGAGPGYRFARESCHAPPLAARQRIEAYGRLDDPPTIDAAG